MARQSISLTEPNDDWLKNQVSSKEYASKSELVNDLIRQARKQQRHIDWINSKLERAENSGFTDDGKTQILAKSKSHKDVLANPIPITIGILGCGHLFLIP